MSGLRNDLLPVLIESGKNIESSNEPLCMIRTALAVTDTIFTEGSYSSTWQKVI